MTVGVEGILGVGAGRRPTSSLLKGAGAAGVDSGEDSGVSSESTSALWHLEFGRNPMSGVLLIKSRRAADIQGCHVVVDARCAAQAK